MNKTKTSLIALALLLCNLTASAYDFEVDGIYYNILSASDRTVEVTTNEEQTDGGPSSVYKGHVVVPNKVLYNNIEFVVCGIGERAFHASTELLSIILPETIKYIGYEAFCGCRSLKSVILPESLEGIGDSAFYGCSSLSLRLPPDIYIGGNALHGLKVVWFPNPITQGAAVTASGYPFDKSAKWLLVSGTCHMEIPSDTETGFATVNVSYVDYYSYIYMMYGVEGHFIEYSPSLTEAEITTILETGGEVIIDGIIYSITSLGGKFAMEVYGCEPEITTAKIVPTVNYINREFTVTSINESAFSKAKNLKSVTIPNSIGRIGKNVFSSCTSIKDVIVKGTTPPVLLDGCFDAMTQLGATLYVPKGTVDDYKAADVWKGFGTIGEGPCTITYLVDDSIYAIEKVSYWADLNLMEGPTKEGYTFSGWNGAPEKVSDEDITVEGTFTVNRYRLTYLLDSMEYSVDSIAYGTELVQKDSLFKEGYTFSGWSELPDSMPARDVTVEGSFIVNRYRLTYLLDSMEYSVDSIAYGTELVQKDSLFKEGYTFSGWSELPDSMPARDVTVEGSFTVNHYTLLYIIDGEVYATEKVAYGENIMLKEVPSKEGYAFCGWSEVPATMPANDLTVTGTFTPLVYCDTPTISYSNGKLMFECTTDGAECVANIVSDDFLEHVGHEMELTLTYQVNVYAKAEGHVNSEVVTATICWIECDHQSEAHETTAIPATVVLLQSSNGIIIIQGLEKGTSVSVYTVSGMEVASGVAEENVTLTLDTQMTKGEVAIVKMGAKSVKVMMK